MADVSPEDQRAFDAIQAEKETLGLADEPVETPAAEPEPAKEPEAPKEEVNGKVTTEPEKESEPEQASPRDFKEWKKQIREEIQSDFDKKLDAIKAEYAKEKPSEAKTENLEDDIKTLAKELEFEESKVKRIIEVARKGLESSPEDKKFLDEAKTEIEQLRAEKAQREQEAIFNGEWGQALKTIREQFPNATEEQIAKAKETMDELSHSEKYHELDLDYILFKEKDAFSKLLFSPKQKTFESARPTATPKDDDEWPELRPDMSPAEYEAVEKRRAAILARMGDGNQVRVTTRDDGGRLQERWE